MSWSLLTDDIPGYLKVLFCELEILSRQLYCLWLLKHDTNIRQNHGIVRLFHTLWQDSIWNVHYYHTCPRILKVWLSSSSLIAITPGTFLARWMLAPRGPIARPVRFFLTFTSSTYRDAPCSLVLEGSTRIVFNFNSSINVEQKD